MTEQTHFPYLHGFSSEEQERLRTQAKFQETTIYRDIDYGKSKDILEVGCGVGAQSEILLRRFPDINLTGIDLNPKQLESAKASLANLTYAKDRYSLQEMNAQQMSFSSNQFEGAFLCWVLEHVPEPEKVLAEVRRVLRPGSKVYITEVMNSSFFLDPYSPNVWKYWIAFNDYQYANAGDPFIGAKLGNLLLSQGLRDISTQVKTWHFDNRDPDRRKEVIEFWTSLLMSAKDHLIDSNSITEEVAINAEKELQNVARDPNAVFYYSFIQAQATVY